MRTLHGASTRTQRSAHAQAGQGGSAHAVFKKSRDFGLDFARVVVGNVVMRWGPPGVRDKRLAGEDAVVVRGWSVRARENRC